MITIENNKLRVKINPLGAELVSLVVLDTNTEFMWNADPKYWGKTSPILFPIVGGLKDETYIFEGKKYNLPRHGFARTMLFEVEFQTSDSATFFLQNTEETEKVFPFKFELRLVYSIVKNSLSIKYIVKNPSEETLWFSIGGHPAFKCPIEESLNYEDYYLEFDENENLERWPLNNVGLVLDKPIVISKNTRILPLKKELFHQDALVLKHLNSDSIVLKSDKNHKHLKFTFKNFPYFGIWAAKNADFVCLEPWCGIADSADTNQDFKTKEGTIELESGRFFEREYTIEI